VVPDDEAPRSWIPAFAGMTGGVNVGMTGERRASIMVEMRAGVRRRVVTGALISQVLRSEGVGKDLVEGVALYALAIVDYDLFATELP
jgi:hypothetical protein